MIRVLVFCLFCLPGHALAQDFPALFDVTGVASDDVLNIREAPDAGAQIIGSFGFLQGNIEVLRTTPDGRWGQVSSGERSGWASMRYLARQPGQDGNDFPKPLFCVGTEPFWSALIGTGPSVRFDQVGQAPLVLSNAAPAFAAGRSDKFGAAWSGQGARISAIVTRTACNDGMSDRAFGFSADFLIFPATGPGQLFSGCCSLSEN